ncbi:SRPBCC family protein [Smaragdicoccus niigatensis]|uniref:SRPBCC family protein n=1 Tax=Smaragdicoccus niigatensis TaxID=359359 RepID=UPI00059035D7|nr:SRPBCC family protein [Smaragdicoccus niigatensis]
MRPVVVSQSLDVPVPQGASFARTLPMPITELFNKWYGPFPPIKAVDQHSPGVWGSVGQSRTLKLTGGGSVLETLTHVDGPTSFGYTLTDIKGPMEVLVSHIEGAWTFASAGSGTLITWQWTVHPKYAVTAPLVPALGMMWNGYARQVLRSLSGYLQGATV